MDLPEIEHILEDKYQSMKLKGWDKEEDDYALVTTQSNKKTSKKAFKRCCGYCGEFGHKAADCPNKKSNQNKGSKGTPNHKKKQSTKGDHKRKGHKHMSKIKCFNCGEYGHYAPDCPKPHDNANVAPESVQNKKLKNMLNLDNSTISEEFMMMCMEVQYEDGDEDLIVYGDQGVSTEQHDEVLYTELTKPKAKKKRKLSTTWPYANNSMSLEKKRMCLIENMPNENIHNISQSDMSLNENPTGNTFNNEVMTVQGPMGDDNEIESWKVWTIEMLMNNGDILTTMTNGLKQAKEDHKKFLYARAIHSNHAIQYHMQQIME